MKIKKILSLLLVMLPTGLILARGNVLPGDEVERVRAFTRQVEFDYVTWIADALFLRGSEEALGVSRYLGENKREDVVREYLALVSRQKQIGDQINLIYADPAVRNPQTASTDLVQQQVEITRRMDSISPLAESILQSQVSSVVAASGLAVGGQPIPQVWYHTTPLPLALIVSPRDRIETEADISLHADLKIDQIVTIEEQVSKDLNVSALVVPVGGIGVYPTMVMRTTDINWLAEVVAHEWIHNYLTLRPLGVRYDTTPELRTMNETTAAIAGKEIGQQVILQYYPEYAPPPPALESSPEPSSGTGSPGFNFNAEMRSVRVHVDELLAAGKIDEAEQYMEERRQVFVANGYAIRKLNQAYFAFHGSYADEPGGAAGEDPVGPAVRALRASSRSLADFLQTISRMTSFDQLQDTVGG